MAESKMVKLWFTYAIRDLKVAKLSLERGSEFKNISAFHAQQCVEKVAKGFLAKHKVRFQKTHDIEKLGNDVLQIDPALGKLFLKAKKLNAYAVAYRYPDAEKKPLTVAKARSAVKQAHTIYDRCYKAAFGKSDRSRFLKSFNH